MSDQSKRRGGDSDVYIQVALKNGLLTSEEVVEVREIQRKIMALGVTAQSLPSILVEKEYLTRDQHERIRAHMERLAPRAEIAGYRLLRLLGKGSMGTVYKALQEGTGRIVAVKILVPVLQKNERFVGRFIKEAKAMARLDHPNIVQCVDIGISRGTYYMAMEFCDGPTVGDILKRGGTLNELRAVQLVHQVAEALEHAHADGFLHRDIKPDNILVVDNGVAKLSDLGLVKDLDSGGDTTDIGVTLGTPNYISPEQARGDDSVDFRSDIYSLGATFYHMVTGSTPFVYPNPAVLMVAHINEVPMKPRERNPSLRPETNRIIMKMIRKSRSDRYQDHKALVFDLAHLTRALGGSTDRTPVPKLTRRRHRR